MPVKDQTPRLHTTGKPLASQAGAHKVFLAGWAISLGIHLLIATGLLVFARGGLAPAAITHPVPQTTVEKPVEPLLSAPLIEALPSGPARDSGPMENSLAAPLPRAQVQPAMAPGIVDPSGSAIAGVGGSGEGHFVVPASTATSEFCGSTGDELYISYVVDCSGSMVLALDYVRRELIRSISHLAANQYFQIIVYADGPPQEWPAGKLLRAHAGNRAAAIAFIKTLGLTKVTTTQSGAQALAEAMQKAFAAQAPDGKGCELIYLLTDGEYDHAYVTEQLRQLQARRPTPVTLNVIACGNDDNAQFLNHLSSRYGGQYVFVSDDQMALALKETP